MSKQVTSATAYVSASSLPYQPTPQCLRELVLDYLLHNAYIGTARAFARESDILVHAHEISPKDSLEGYNPPLSANAKDDDMRSHDLEIKREGYASSNEGIDEDMEMGTETANLITVDDEMDTREESEDEQFEGISNETLENARRRREIRDHILSGRVEAATQLLEKYFPSVLSITENENMSQIDMHTQNTMKSKSSLPQEKKSFSNPPSSSGSRKNTPHERVHYTSQLSIKPIHIALNLRILAFIEGARTVPLPYPRDPPRSSVFSSLSTSASTSASSLSPHLLGSTTSSTISSNHSPGSITDPTDAHSTHQTALVHAAQRLYSTVESLQDISDREIYRKELNAVGGLLAYRIPEKSPMACYLTQERRAAVADQVNSAILFHIGDPATSYIELYFRQTSTIWNTMRDLAMQLPPASQYPLGRYPVLLPRAGIVSEDNLEITRALTSNGAATLGNSSNDGTGREEGMNTKGKGEKANNEPIPTFDLRLFLGLTS